MNNARTRLPGGNGGLVITASVRTLDPTLLRCVAILSAA